MDSQKDTYLPAGTDSAAFLPLSSLGIHHRIFRYQNHPDANRKRQSCCHECIFNCAAGAVCLYNCIRPLLLRLCLCIRHLRRCCTRRLSVSLQKSQEKATAFEKKLAKALVVSEIRHFAGNCSALLLRRIRQPARL